MNRSLDSTFFLPKLHPRFGPGWYQVFAFDRATGVDDSVVVTAAGVEPHRRRIFTSEEVAAAAAAAGLVAADQLHRGLLRYLSRGGGRDFYALKRAAP